MMVIAKRGRCQWRWRHRWKGKGRVRLLPGILFVLILIVSSASVEARSRPSPRAEQQAMEAALMAHIRVLASDAFEGRRPGTQGERKTLEYLVKQWSEIGLSPGANNADQAWLSPVKLGVREAGHFEATFVSGGQRAWLADDALALFASGRQGKINSAPVVFVGTEQHAFVRNELAGRVVIILAEGDSAAIQSQQNGLFAAGAAAVLQVVNDQSALNAFVKRRRRTRYFLADDRNDGDSGNNTFLDGAITRDGVEAILSPSSRELSDFVTASRQEPAQPIPMGITATLAASNQQNIILSHNLLGKLPGSAPDGNIVLFLAHWDHFGLCEEQPDGEPCVCNGAIDNASGVAALTELARKLSGGPPVKRDVYFLATTAEEYGLLGAYAFAENPSVPIRQIIAAFNIDTVAIAPAGSPLVIVGEGMTDLDRDIKAVARRARRKVVHVPDANQYIERQDGWALFQHDIPTVMVTSAYSDMKKMNAYFETRYHQPGDNLEQSIELGGAAQDVDFYAALARWFGNPHSVPDRVHIAGIENSPE